MNKIVKLLKANFKKLEILETNGKNAISTTWHTYNSTNKVEKCQTSDSFKKNDINCSDCNCSQDGCYQPIYLNNNWFKTSKCSLKGAIDGSIINYKKPFTLLDIIDTKLGKNTNQKNN